MLGVAPKAPHFTCIVGLFGVTAAISAINVISGASRGRDAETKPAL